MPCAFHGSLQEQQRSTSTSSTSSSRAQRGQAVGAATRCSASAGSGLLRRSGRPRSGCLAARSTSTPQCCASWPRRQAFRLICSTRAAPASTARLQCSTPAETACLPPAVHLGLQASDFSRSPRPSPLPRTTTARDDEKICASPTTSNVGRVAWLPRCRPRRPFQDHAPVASLTARRSLAVPSPRRWERLQRRPLAPQPHGTTRRRRRSVSQRQT